jgi:hypothetical protein
MKDLILKQSKFYLIKLATDFYWQPSPLKKVKLCYKFQFWRETTHANQRRQCCSLSFATPTTDCCPILRVVKCLASDCSTVAEYWTHPLRSKVQIWILPLPARERDKGQNTWKNGQLQNSQPIQKSTQKLEFENANVIEIALLWSDM